MSASIAQNMRACQAPLSARCVQNARTFRLTNQSVRTFTPSLTPCGGFFTLVGENSKRNSFNWFAILPTYYLSAGVSIVQTTTEEKVPRVCRHLARFSPLWGKTLRTMLAIGEKVAPGRPHLQDGGPASPRRGGLTASRQRSTIRDGARERDSRGAILHQHPWNGGLSCHRLS
jgi:hypothetical protein